MYSRIDVWNIKRPTREADNLKEEYMSCIAIDLHCDCFTTARRESLEDKPVKLVRNYYLDDESFSEFKKTLKSDDYIAIEATTNAFWFYDQISPYVKKVYVLDTNKVNFKGNKTDKIDAKKLLDVLEYYVYIKNNKGIPCVTVPSEVTRKLREIFATYKLQKKIINQLKNRVYSLLKQHGYQLKKAILKSKKGREEVKNLISDEIIKIEIFILLDQLQVVENYVKILIDIMSDLGEKYLHKEINLLLSIPGFTHLTALALLSDIGDVNRFPNVKKYCSYLRVAPTIKESNKTTHLGRINKKSRSLTVTIFTQSINHFRTSSTYFENFYSKLKAGKSYGKTRIALIRKILVSTYFMLKRDQPFKWSNKSDVDSKMKEFEARARKGEDIINKIA